MLDVCIVVLLVVMQARTFVRCVRKIQTLSHHSLSSMTWCPRRSLKFTMAHLTTFWICMRTFVTFCDIQLQCQMASPCHALRVARRRTYMQGRHMNGSSTQSQVHAMAVTQRLFGGCFHSCPSVPSLTVQVRFLICLSTVMMTSGCQQWSDQKHVVIIP